MEAAVSEIFAVKSSCMVDEDVIQEIDIPWNPLYLENTIENYVEFLGQQLKENETQIMTFPAINENDLTVNNQIPTYENIYEGETGMHFLSARILFYGARKCKFHGNLRHGFLYSMFHSYICGKILFIA